MTTLPGLYTPESTLWRVNRELALMLIGTRALLLEIAHPLVAQGVVDHSDFARRPLGRLFRTVRTMQQLSFGDGRAARAGVRHVHHCHQSVHGSLPEAVGRFPAGTPYDANDPSLRLWVFATLVDSIMLGFETLVEPLSEFERAAYYQDSLPMAAMLGVPAGLMPPSYPAFQAYIQEMIEGDSLVVGPAGLRIKQALFYHRWLGPGVRMAGFAGVAMLPASLRQAFEFRWGPAEDRRFARLAGLVRGARAITPDIFATHPQAWIGVLRQPSG